MWHILRHDVEWRLQGTHTWGTDRGIKTLANKHAVMIITNEKFKGNKDVCGHSPSSWTRLGCLTSFITAASFRNSSTSIVSSCHEKKCRKIQKKVFMRDRNNTVVIQKSASRWQSIPTAQHFATFNQTKVADSLPSKEVIINTTL